MLRFLLVSSAEEDTKQSDDAWAGKCLPYPVRSLASLKVFTKGRASTK